MSTPKLFDVHTHTQFVAFRNDAALVIERALQQGVWLVNVGAEKNTSKRAVDFSAKHPYGVYAAVGLHPIHTEKSYHDPKEFGVDEGFMTHGEEFDYGYYQTLAQNPKVVAIGECGLDYYRLGDETKEKQRATFVRQIELAHEVKKPLMIHCRNAFADLTSILQATSYQLPANPGIIHFFSGTKEDARELLGLGFSFSFGGVITFAPVYDEVVKYIPLERILLETDAPYVAPVPYRGQRNEPAYVTEVAKKIAELKGLSFEEIAANTTDNAQKLLAI